MTSLVDVILNSSNSKLVIRHFLKDLAPEHGGERMERRRSSLDQCGNKQDHICVHAGAHSQRTCSLPKPCRILKSRGKKGFGNAREVAWILLCTGQMFAQNATNLCCGRVISKCVCLILRPRGPMSGVHSHPASRCVCYLLGVHCMPVAEVRKKIETATQSAMSRDDFNPAEMCFSLAFCVQT